MERKPEPYSDCTSDDDLAQSKSEFVNLILKTGYKYRKVDCIFMCYNKYVSKVCSCQDISAINLFENVGVCLNYTQFECNGNEFQKFFDSDVEAYCGDSCPLECSSIDYDFTVSSTTYPSIS